MVKAKRESLREKFLRAKLKDRKEEAQFSLDINTGIEKLRPEDLLQREAPTSVNDAFVNARKWHRENWFVELMCYLKPSFYNYGLQIKPRKKDDKKVGAAMENPAKVMELHRYIDSVWSEGTLQDTVVSFWRKEAKMTPILLLPENCKYTDAMGIEKLRVAINFKRADLEDAEKFGATSLSPDMMRRYVGKKDILLDEAEDEYFQVLTRGLRGNGFGWPRMRGVFRTLSQNESMEVGESMLALAGRLVERTHEIGFEVKAAANAMKQSDYMWKKKRADEIQKFYNGRAGFVETTRQFDHVTKYIWVDPKWYDNRKWASVIDRLLWYGGPLAFMIMAKTPNPSLMQAFIAEVKQQREWVGRHLEYVIEQGFGLSVKLTWSDRPFYDLRLFSDMVKFYTQQGPLSLTTGMKYFGFDPEEEAVNKKDEAKKERRAELTPLFDQNHNKNGAPGQAGEGAGRPKEKAAQE